MKKFLIWFAVCFIVVLTPPSCVSNAPASYVNDGIPAANLIDLDSPEDSYVHIRRIYSVDMATGPRGYMSTSAGGVCVHADDTGCFVLTVNHFCEENEVLKLPNMRVEITAQNMFSDVAIDTVEIIDVMPEADLCLMRVEGEGFRSVQKLTLPAEIERFESLQNYGAPAGFFNGSERWNLSMYEGRWSGYCSDRCALPDERVLAQHLTLHTIPTTRGQSGSPIFVGAGLFGLQVATNGSIEDFGIAASSNAIYLLLDRNGIYLESWIEE